MCVSLGALLMTDVWCDCVCFCLRTYQQEERKQDKLMTPQKKIGSENLSLKAVIALMGAAAAAATAATAI